MIKEAFRCPYCEVPVAVDCTSGEVVFDPDGSSGSACEHLSCFWICLSFGTCEKLDRSWLGVIDRKIVRIDARSELQNVALTRYIMDCGFGHVSDELLPANTPFEVEGASAAEREETLAGSGQFQIAIRGKLHSAILDGWGIYSEAPQELMTEISQLAFEYEV
jgi:hypothetical protein